MNESLDNALELAREELRATLERVNALKSEVNRSSDLKKSVEAEIRRLQTDLSSLQLLEANAANAAQKDAREETERARKSALELFQKSSDILDAGKSLLVASQRSQKSLEDAAESIKYVLAKALSAANGAAASLDAATELSKESHRTCEESVRLLNVAKTERLESASLLSGSREVLLNAWDSVRKRESELEAIRKSQEAKEKQISEEGQRIRSELAMLASAQSLKR